jgi:hypothetical protein
VYYNTANTTTGAYTALNGIANLTCGAIPVFTPDGNLQVGGRTWDVAGRIFVGNIAELVYYDGNTANASQINRIESYLAMKYGITLGSTSSLINYTASDGVTVAWTGNSTYQNDVFGIGKDNGSGFLQTQSNSMNSGSGSGVGQSGLGNLVLTNLNAMGNKTFLMIGNDAGALTEQTTNIPAAITGAKRLSRTWRVQNTGAIGSVNLSFDKTGLTLSGGSSLSNYVLMINPAGSSNFVGATPTYYVASSITGNLINFTGVTLVNNAVFTIVTLAGGFLLPVTWLNFTVGREGNNIKLSWTTTAESNVDHYEAEQSRDGLVYTTVGRVAAKNNPLQNNYTLMLSGVPPGISYYRIKSIDADGHYIYSDVQKINAGNSVFVALQSNLISGSQLHLNVTSDHPETVVVRILNEEGRLLLLQTSNIQSGTISLEPDISRLPAGLYFVQTQVGQLWTTNKFIKR